ncbi:hypothetical protein EBT31_02910 [bacterium]|nr:hypothetical protein [bacterium]NBX48634.1 hypothetical protein [bacterium]
MFGMDAIERQRVSAPQSLIDSDFEYGLQATKWQGYSHYRLTPTFYETVGADLPVTATNGVVSTSVATYASYSIITITFQSAPSPAFAVNDVVTIFGLNNADGTASRAEGFYLVQSVPNSTTIRYFSRNIVTAGDLTTPYTVVKRGGKYDNANTYIRVSTCVGDGTKQALTFASNVLVQTTGAHNLMPGAAISVVTSAFSNASGSYIVDRVYDTNKFSYVANGFVSTASVPLTTPAGIYVQPFAYQLHRPFDGGVIISPNIGTFGACTLRQSKKYFRYQSGKAFIWSTGTVLSPTNDISNVVAIGDLSPGTVIRVQTGVEHCLQAGAIVTLKGLDTQEYNNSYTVSNIYDDNTFEVLAGNFLSTTSPTFGEQPRWTATSWKGACVRTGIFDDQNGIFWEFDGERLWVVKRSSTYQLSGTVTVTPGATTVTGSSTYFQQQLTPGDRVVIKGMTYIVGTITDNTTMEISPPFRGFGDTTSIARIQIAKVRDLRTPQAQFNMDTIDGNGLSGFKVDTTKMHMLGIQYTWYGAGFIDYMIRGADGNFVYCHRVRNNNVNDEAYMRTGNMAARYEVINEWASARAKLGFGTSDASPANGEFLTLDRPTVYFPSNGYVMVGSELISYTGTSGNTLTGITRGTTMTAFVAGKTRVLNSNVIATAHNQYDPVYLVSCTLSPTLSHWGSAVIMDGNFDSDRGYYFNYSNILPVAATTKANVFMLRLSPSVSNGIVGRLTQRDLINRAQLLLQALEVNILVASGTTTCEIQGVLNPLQTNSALTGVQVNYGAWQSLNTSTNGSQPSFAQILPSNGYTGNVFPGERIFQTVLASTGQQTLDLTALKEISTSVIGGDFIYPDGPDTLALTIRNLTTTAVTQASVNLFWSEAQA